MIAHEHREPRPAYSLSVLYSAGDPTNLVGACVHRANADLPARSKAKEVTGECIHDEPMFHQGGETVNPLSHVGGFKAQEYADRGRQTQHDVSPAIRVARAEVSCEEGNSSFAPEGSVRVHEL